MPRARRSRVDRIQVEPVKPLDQRDGASFIALRARAAQRRIVDGRTGLKALEVALEVQAQHRPLKAPSPIQVE